MTSARLPAATGVKKLHFVETGTSDCRILEWLSSNTENFRLWHNAHRESAISVERYLLHREHIQEPISFVDADMRRCAVRSNSLWELSVRHLDGSQTHIGAPTFELCLKAAREMLLQTFPGAVAA